MRTTIDDPTPPAPSAGAADALLAVVLLVAVAIALAAWLALAPGTETTIDPTLQPETTPAPATAGEYPGVDATRSPRPKARPTAPSSAPSSAPSGADSSADSPADQATRARPTPPTLPANADAEQGVCGRLLLPDDRPAVDVRVQLRTAATDVAVAATTTATDGTFALGATFAGRPLAIHATTPGLPAMIAGPVRPRAGQWHDAGDLWFEAAVVVHGRVVDRATGAGIENATVELDDRIPAHRVRSQPVGSDAAGDRAHGNTTTTDRSGAFRFDNGRSGAACTLTARAPGFTATQVFDPGLPATGSATFTIELDAGEALGGVVVDHRGAPLAGVTVTIGGVAEPRVQTTATSAADGSFFVDSLRAGQCLVSAAGRGYRTATPLLAHTGTTEVRLQVEPEPWVRLQVHSENGQPRQRFHLGLQRLPGSATALGIRAAGFGARLVTPADHDRDGWAAIRGLPSGRFRFTIDAAGHAPTLSEPFEVTPGGLDATARVAVTLALGGTVRGRVTDAAGRPLRDALVRATRTDVTAGHGLPEAFLSQAPGDPAPAQARTGADGRFRLDHLPFGAYDLAVRHQDASETVVLGTLTAEQPTLDLGDITVRRGVEIAGRVAVAGVPTGRIRIVLRAAAEAGDSPPAAGARRRQPFVATAFSRNDGRYRLPRRVPFGEYRIHAERLNGSSNPARALFDSRETERLITIDAGRERLQLDFNLPAR